LKQLFPGISTPDLSDTPKPEELLRHIMELASVPGDRVLDFFGGSGTTAAVAQKLGRRWITIELQETNAEWYLIPRLTKVVDGSDKGGISTSTERIAEAELPEGMTAA